MKVIPLKNRIMIQPFASEGETRGGIIIPDAHREKPRKATVISVGRGRITDAGKLIEPEVKPGDVVLFSRYHSGQAVDATHVVDYRNKDGDGPLLVPEDDLLAIIDEAG